MFFVLVFPLLCLRSLCLCLCFLIITSFFSSLAVSICVIFTIVRRFLSSVHRPLTCSSALLVDFYNCLIFLGSFSSFLVCFIFVISFLCAFSFLHVLCVCVSVLLNYQRFFFLSCVYNFLCFFFGGSSFAFFVASSLHFSLAFGVNFSCLFSYIAFYSFLVSLHCLYFLFSGRFHLRGFLLFRVFYFFMCVSLSVFCSLISVFSSCTHYGLLPSL